jgi:hypothetical protein
MPPLTANDIARDTYQKVSLAMRAERDFSIELRCTNPECPDPDTLIFGSP